MKKRKLNAITATPPIFESQNQVHANINGQAKSNSQLSLLGDNIPIAEIDCSETQEI